MSVPIPVFIENVMFVVFDAPNVAVPVGTVASVQLLRSFQLPVPGAVPQVASWA